MKLIVVALFISSFARADVVSYTRVGNYTYGSNGTTYAHAGNYTYGSDGSTQVRVLNTTYNITPTKVNLKDWNPAEDESQDDDN